MNQLQLDQTWWKRKQNGMNRSGLHLYIGTIMVPSNINLTNWSWGWNQFLITDCHIPSVHASMGPIFQNFPATDGMVIS